KRTRTLAGGGGAAGSAAAEDWVGAGGSSTMTRRFPYTRGNSTPIGRPAEIAGRATTPLPGPGSGRAEHARSKSKVLAGSGRAPGSLGGPGPAHELHQARLRPSGAGRADGDVRGRLRSSLRGGRVGSVPANSCSHHAPFPGAKLPGR